MKLNTNSNAYTIIYATIVVIIVAVLLALVSQVLSPRQQANVKLDQQKQMLVALNLKIDSIANPAARYEELVRDTIQMNEDSTKANIIRFEVEGQTKYMLRLHGAGLWGGIGGYLALNEDKNTIYGINFNHESETPGLGALIVEEPFRSQFIGKHIRNAEGEIVSVAVLKKGNKAENGEEQVDAVSGATITSTGVSDMLAANLAEYAKFLATKVLYVDGENGRPINIIDFPDADDIVGTMSFTNWDALDCYGIDGLEEVIVIITKTKEE